MSPGIEEARKRLRSRYSSDKFAETGATLLQCLEEYLERCAVADRSLNWRDPETLMTFAEKALEGSTAKELAELYLADTQKLHSPHFLGHQVAPPVPETAAFDLLGSVSNQGCGVYEMGPFPVAVEKVIANRLAAKIGWTAGFGHIVTHGGTLANLTAILAARNFHFPGSWEDGIGDRGKPAVLASEDSHYSISRAAGIAGLGSKAVLPLPLDARRRVDPELLEEVYEAARADGKAPFCLVATSGSTAAGAFDNLPLLADFCRKKKLWLHVDGAHGASVLFSAKHRHLVEGIELADSVTWDAHKMMHVPALCTFLLYRQKAKSYAPFQMDAPYLVDKEALRLQDFDCVHRTVECTKRSLAVPVWAAWSMYGEGHFGDLVDVTFDSTRRFFELLSESEDFEPCHEPQSNILCFRYREAHSQLDIRRRLLKSGHYYITTARLNGEMVLRVTVMNPFVDDSHFLGLLDEIRGR